MVSIPMENVILLTYTSDITSTLVSETARAWVLVVDIDTISRYSITGHWDGLKWITPSPSR